MTLGASLRVGLAAALSILAGCRKTPAPEPAKGATTTVSEAATATPAAVPGTPPAELTAVVDDYRRIIVLMSDEATLPEKERPNAFLAGKLLFERNRKRLIAMEVRAFDEAASPKTPFVDALLAAIETGPALRDADKLVVRDLVIAAEEQAKEPLLSRLRKAHATLDEIRSLYDKELEKIFGQFETRGLPVRRESWESYVAHLRTLYEAPKILEALRPEITSITAPEVRPGKVLSGVELPPKTLVLTFDDGPHAKRTKEILDILETFSAKSIFFQVGQNLGDVNTKGEASRSKTSAWNKAILAGGHLVGNHSFSHAFLPKLEASPLSVEIGKTSQLLTAVDEAAPLLFRPPYGALDKRVRAEAESRSMRVMLWNIDSMDWADPVPKSIANRVIAEARNQGRGVVLFHDIHSQTVTALPLILETLQAEGFRFVLWDGTRIVDRGAPAPAAPPPAEAAPLYRESWAVVVGINDYEKWPKLGYAVRDALAMRDVLVDKLGFPASNVVTLLDKDATRERILSVLGDTLADPKKVKKDDRVLVFFAGHGATRALPSGRSLGYIVPVDAGTESFQGQAISMSNFQDVSEAIPAKHVFFITDACYSGLALVRGGVPSQYLSQITSRAAREVLTAGGADQQVADGGPGGHSIFTWTLLQGLEGKADLNGDGYVTATELAAYAAPIVSSLSKQTPAFGSLVGSEGGDFVFTLSHEGEFLSTTSKQLDDEALDLNAKLLGLKQEIAAKRARNAALSKELEQAQKEARDAAVAAPAPAESAKRAVDRGLLAYRDKRYDDALAAFQEALHHAPGNAQVANNIGFVYYRMEKPAEALSWYEKTLAIDPNRVIAWANKGEVLEKLGKPAESIAAYETFLKKAPKHPSAAYVKGRLAALRETK